MATSMKNLFRKKSNDRTTEPAQEEENVHPVKAETERTPRRARSLRNFWPSKKNVMAPSSAKMNQSMPVLVIEDSTRTAETAHSNCNNDSDGDDDVLDVGSTTDSCLTATPPRSVVVVAAAAVVVEQESPTELVPEEDSPTVVPPPSEAEKKNEALVPEVTEAGAVVVPDTEAAAAAAVVVAPEMEEPEVEVEVDVDAKDDPVLPPPVSRVAHHLDQVPDNMETEELQGEEEEKEETAPELPVEDVVSQSVDDSVMVPETEDAVAPKTSEPEERNETVLELIDLLKDAPETLVEDGVSESEEDFVVSEAKDKAPKISEAEEDKGRVEIDSDSDEDAELVMETEESDEEEEVEDRPESINVLTVRDSMVLCRQQLPTIKEEPLSSHFFPVVAIVVTVAVLVGVLALSIHHLEVNNLSGNFEQWELLPTMNFNGLKSLDIRGLPALDWDDVAALFGRGAATTKAETMVRTSAAWPLHGACQGAYCGFGV